MAYELVVSRCFSKPPLRPQNQIGSQEIGDRRTGGILHKTQSKKYPNTAPN